MSIATLSQTSSAAEEKEIQSAAPRSAIRETSTEPPIATSPEEVESRLTKNWGGLRKTLSAKGFDLALIYKAEYDSVLSGGLEQKSATLTNIDLRLSFDFEKMLAWKGGSAFLYGLFNHGGDFSAYVGDKQVTSNIETPVDITKLYEAWVQQLAFEDKVSFLFGLHDLNSEFYVTETSTLFFNSSFGVGRDLSQTGSRGPSIFPTTSVAFRVRTEPTKSFYLQFGVFNAVASDLTHNLEFRIKASDGALLIGEAAWLSGREENSKDRPGKVAVGVWSWSTPSDHLLSSVDSRYGKGINQGAYFLADRTLSDTFSAFVRYGIASTEVNVFGSDFGLGVVAKGLLPGRAQDRFGLAMTRVNPGEEFSQLERLGGKVLSSSETAYEANYRIELLPGVAVQPAFQYVQNPGVDSAIPNATLISVRAELSL